MNTTTQQNNLGRGNWTEQKAKLKAKFPVLTDTDLNYENGKKDEMIAGILKKLGKTGEEITAIIEKP
jgi:uncharacterized protein YjbJ (UPF0337 family)